PVEVASRGQGTYQPTPGSPASQTVVRQTAPPAQPFDDGQRMVVRGQAPEQEGGFDNRQGAAPAPASVPARNFAPQPTLPPPRPHLGPPAPPAAPPRGRRAAAPAPGGPPGSPGPPPFSPRPRPAPARRSPPPPPRSATRSNSRIPPPPRQAGRTDEVCPACFC